MAYPSGSGSEVLKRTLIHAQSNTATAFRWDGTMATTGTSTYTVTATHIITVISIIANEQANADELINLYMNDGTNNHQLLQNQDLPAYTTYVWNDKFVLYGGDKLIVNLGSAGNVDFICSYIDQDWT
tara:strand:+ start:569 stop:952 length:384 start_codon:yes stop_codon:yes gene_type:complete